MSVSSKSMECVALPGALLWKIGDDDVMIGSPPSGELSSIMSSGLTVLAVLLLWKKEHTWRMRNAIKQRNLFPFRSSFFFWRSLPWSQSQNHPLAAVVLKCAGRHVGDDVCLPECPDQMGEGHTTRWGGGRVWPCWGSNHLRSKRHTRELKRAVYSGWSLTWARCSVPSWWQASYSPAASRPAS